MANKNYHFIGMGGAGMSVVAQLFQARGWSITGSDRNHSPNLQQLLQLGVDCWVGSDPQRIPPDSTLVVSTAIRETDPELSFARQQGWEVIHRSQALALVCQEMQFIAVAGAHGKTTTSGMLAEAFSAAGVDLSFAIGGLVKAFGTGAHLGNGQFFVAEADESDASFLNYRPYLAIITNIEPDHLDNYRTQQAFEEAFYQFARRIKAGGCLILNTDDPGCCRLLKRIVAEQKGAPPQPENRQVTVPRPPFSTQIQPVEANFAEIKIWGYGRQERPDGLASYCRISSENAKFASQSANYQVDQGSRQPVHLRLPGAHNIANAAAAYLAGLYCGVESSMMAKALTSFQGTARRFETRGQIGQIRIVDDYAHHPTEVQALIAQARQALEGGHLLVVFQPHLYSRTLNFAKRFAQALDQADWVIVTDIYAAREDPIPGCTAQLITDQMEKGKYIGDMAQAAAEVARIAQPRDLILTVGAGDITQIGDLIMKHLSYRFGA